MNTTEQIVYPRLRITHNHGFMLLANATLDPASGYVTGTCLAGGETSRLFHATSTRQYPVGEQNRWPLYGREPRHEMSRGFGQDGKWHETPTPGNFYIDCCFCG